jgi:predicted transcriptional regulator
MKAQDIVRILEGKVFTGDEFLDIEISSGCGADLMSDVMAFVKENVVMLTGLVTPQAIRTAELMDIRMVVFVRGKTPTPEMIELAKEHDVILACSKYSMFLSCGKLYEGGLRLGGMREIS